MEGNDTSVRILDLLFELTSAERGRSRNQIRKLAHYASLSDEAFESAFSRDKETLKRVGVEIDVSKRGEQLIYRLKSPSVHIAFSNEEINLIALASSAWESTEPNRIASTKALAYSNSPESHQLNFRLSGVEHVLPLYQAISAACVVSFTYRSPRSTELRAVEPWNLMISGSAIYLRGFDLDRESERTYRLSRISAPIEILGQPGDARERPQENEKHHISPALQPIYAVRVGSTPWDEACLRDEKLEESMGDWQLFMGNSAPSYFWLRYMLLHSHDCVVVAPTDFCTVLRGKLIDAVKLQEDDHA